MASCYVSESSSFYLSPVGHPHNGPDCTFPVFEFTPASLHPPFCSDLKAFPFLASTNLILRTTFPTSWSILIYLVNPFSGSETQSMQTNIIAPIVRYGGGLLLSRVVFGYVPVSNQHRSYLVPLPYPPSSHSLPISPSLSLCTSDLASERILYVSHVYYLSSCPSVLHATEISYVLVTQKAPPQPSTLTARPVTVCI
ncbi:hypothetical protein EI94DRAFT_137433 [Lactarius quietus]|nr:hypothetical protein EI94DRAFT_137433 [Lactarius quietus]